MIQNIKSLALFLLAIFNIVVANAEEIYVKYLEESENGAVLVILEFERLSHPLEVVTAQFTDQKGFVQFSGWGELEQIDRTPNLIKAMNPLIKEMVVRNNYKGNVSLNIETVQPAAYFIVQRENKLIINIQPLQDNAERFSMVMNESDDKTAMRLGELSEINFLGHLDPVDGNLIVIAHQFSKKEWLKTYFFHRNVLITPYKDLFLLSMKPLDLSLLSFNVSVADDVISIHFPSEASQLILSILSDFSDQVIYRDGDFVEVVTAVKNISWIQVLEGIAILNHKVIYSIDHAVIIGDSDVVEKNIREGCFNSPLWTEIYNFRELYEWVDFQGNPEKILQAVNNVMTEVEHSNNCQNIQILQRYHNLRENIDGSYSIRVLAMSFLLEKFEALSKSMQNAQ